jgi:hypothetical protein
MKEGHAYVRVQTYLHLLHQLSSPLLHHRVRCSAPLLLFLTSLLTKYQCYSLLEEHSNISTKVLTTTQIKNFKTIREVQIFKICVLLQ